MSDEHDQDEGMRTEAPATRRVQVVSWVLSAVMHGAFRSVAFLTPHTESEFDV